MNILQITNYPTVNPMHGGQIRCAEIAKAFRKAGHEVASVAIYIKDHYSEIGVHDIEFDINQSKWKNQSPWLSDFYTGLHCDEDPTNFKKIKKQFSNHKFDYIIVEHPWLSALANKLCVIFQARLVYSSHNIEWRLKEKMLMSDGASNIDQIISEIQTLEFAAMRSANVILTCTDDDKQYTRAIIGMATSVPIVVSGNGVEPFSCLDERVSDWRGFFGIPTIVFVGSCHLPNATGFWEMLYPGLTFLKPTEKILVIGGVGQILMQPKGAKNFEAVNASRLDIAGTREKIELQAMVRASHIVILPITEGEGSNLKTAEALESGCYIVATTKAFRGYEASMRLPHVAIADTPVEFRKAIRDFLNTPRNNNLKRSAGIDAYYWENQLSSAIKALEDIHI